MNIYHIHQHIHTALIWLLVTFFLGVTIPSSAADKDYELLPDSSNYVLVSLLVTSSGEEGFYSLGHSALRLECPVHDLDYCFSYNTVIEPGLLFNLKLLVGQMTAGYERVPYDMYVARFHRNGQGVTQYPINLTRHEKQELWREMDHQTAKGHDRPFDFLFNNCTTTLFRSLSTIMEREDFEYAPSPLLTMGIRDYISNTMHDSPWLELMTVTMASGFAREELPIDAKVSPYIWGQLLTTADIVGLDGSRRPALAGPPVQITPKKLQVDPVPWSPIRVFGALLLFVVLVTLAEKFFHWHTLAACTDRLLFILHSVLSVYLLYASCIQLFGMFWNWMLIVFNPVPLILWLFFRHRKWYHQVWLVYALILVAFMIFLPIWTGHLELPHQLVFATLLIRCLSRYFHQQDQPMA